MPIFINSGGWGGSCAPLTHADIVGLIVYGVMMIPCTILIFWYVKRYGDEPDFMADHTSPVSMAMNFTLSTLWPFIFIFGAISIFFKERERAKNRKKFGI